MATQPWEAQYLYDLPDFGGDPWVPGVLARPPEWLRGRPQEEVDRWREIYATVPPEQIDGALAGMRGDPNVGLPRNSAGGLDEGDANLLPYVDDYIMGGAGAVSGAAGSGMPAAGAGGGAGVGGGPFSFAPFNPSPLTYPEWNAPEWNVGEFAPQAGGDVIDLGYDAGAQAFTVGGSPVLSKRADYAAPAPFAYDEFVGPTAETFQADPGYDFRAKEGNRAIVNAQAAAGLARSGDALKGLAEYNQGLASQEFGNVFNRAFSTHQANQAGRAGAYQMNAGLARDAHALNLGADADFYGRLLSTADTQRASRAQQFGEQADIYDRQYQAGEGRFNRALTSHLTGYGRASDDWERGASVFDRNLGAATAGAGLNLSSRDLTLREGDSQWRNLLSLYDLSTRNLPRYDPYEPAY